MKFPISALLLALFASGHAYAANSMLRISCDGENAGAAISINGKFKGECPMDVQVEEGIVKLKAVQKTAGSDDKQFEKELRIGGGVVQKIQVQLLGKKAFDDLKRAEAGDLVAISIVGASYVFGSNGFPQSKDLSFFWYRKAAQAGVSSAMFTVGDAYRRGDGVEKNDDLANDWYRRGHEQIAKEIKNGDTEAMLLLGDAYAMGKGVPVDKSKAKSWFLQARDKGDKYAEKYLDLRELR